MKSHKILAGMLFAALLALLTFSVFDIGVSQNAGGHYLTLNVRTLLNVVGKTVMGDSARVQGNLLVNGTTTLAGRFIASGASFAKIDSFSTTTATKITYMPGATLGDVFLVSEYTPSYSAVPDTGCKYTTYWQTTDSVGILRTKIAAVSALKSGALFGVVKIDK